MATKKKNNKTSEDNVTAQCDQYIAEAKSSTPNSEKRE
jgi:hypothetical protein